MMNTSFALVSLSIIYRALVCNAMVKSRANASLVWRSRADEIFRGEKKFFIVDPARVLFLNFGPLHDADDDTIFDYSESPWAGG